MHYYSDQSSASTLRPSIETINAKNRRKPGQIYLIVAQVCHHKVDIYLLTRDLYYVHLAGWHLTANEEKMAENYKERRLRPRIDIDGDMSYKTSDSDQVREGLLENLSSEGARIWIDQELPAASQLFIRMESGSQDADFMTFRATLLYKLPQQKLSQHGYGCRIETSAGWQSEQD